MRSEFVQKFLTLLLFATSCGGREIAGTDGNTHWLRCEDDEDCDNHSCIDGFCRTEAEVTGAFSDTGELPVGDSSTTLDPVSPSDPVETQPDAPAGFRYASSVPGALGAACIPSDEYSATFRGFSYKDVSLAHTEQCDSNLCLVNHFQGRVTCPYGQSPDSGECFTADGNTKVSVDVSRQLVDRRPEESVYCSCRCDGPDPGAEYCACGQGFECAPATTLSMPDYEDQAGSYCVVAGTNKNPNAIAHTACVAEDQDAACGDTSEYTPEALGISPVSDAELSPTTNILLAPLVNPSNDEACLPIHLPLRTDEAGEVQASCRLFEASLGDDGACDRPGRQPVSDADALAIMSNHKENSRCDSDCSDYTVCELEQLTGPAAAMTCLNDEGATGDGWCYVDPAAGQGSSTLVSQCQSGSEQRLRILSEISESNMVSLFCMGAP